MATQVAIDDLSNWLSNQPDNTVDTPYEIEITGLTENNYSNIEAVLKANNSKYVDLSNTELPLDTTGYYGYVFYGCTTLVIPPVFPNGTIYMNEAFNGCSSLKIPPIIPNGVTDLTATFQYCVNLQYAPVIPSSVTSMHATFHNCVSLTEPPIIPNNVTDMAYCFIDCTSLLTVPEIPNGVITIEKCFSNCESITEIPYIPDSVTGFNDCFQNCYNLIYKRIALNLSYNAHAYSGVPTTIWEGLESQLGWWSQTQPNGAEIYIIEWNKVVVNISKSNLSTWLGNQTINTKENPFSIYIYDLESTDFPKADHSTNVIRTALTNNSTKYVDLSSTILPTGILITNTGVDMPYISNAFLNCTSLIKAPQMPSDLYGTMNTYEGCSNLVEAELPPNGNLNQYTFKNCTSFVDAPSIPSSVVTAEGMFQGCTSLKSVPAFPTACVNVGGTFKGCTSLEKISGLSANVQTVENLFEGCTSLKRTPLFSNNVTSMKETFKGCSSLTINGGEGTTGKGIAIYHGTNYATSGDADDREVFPTINSVNKFFAPTLTKAVNGETVDLEHDTIGNLNISDSFSDFGIGHYVWGTRHYIVENVQTGVKYLFFSTDFYNPSVEFIPLDNFTVDNTNKIVLLDNNNYILIQQIQLYSTDTAFIYTDSNKTEEISYKLGDFSYYGGLRCVPGYLEVGETFYIDNEIVKQEGEARFTATFRVIYNDVLLQATSGVAYTDTEFQIPSSVTNLNSAFMNCASITKTPTIPNAVTNMNQTFYGCESITEASEIPGSVTTLQRCFAGCTNLEEAPSIKNGVTNMSMTFYNCYALETVPNIPESVTSLAFCFYGDSNLESIDKFDITTSYISSNKSNFEDAFSGCTSLVHIGVNTEVSPVETEDFHLVYLDFSNSSVKGKIYSRNGTSITVTETAITKTTITLPIQTDELMFATISDSDLEPIIAKMLQNHKSWFGKSVLDPEGGSLVFWANDKNKFVTNLDMGGGGGSSITVYDNEEELEEDLPNKNDGDIVATYGDGKNEFQDAPLGSIMEYLGTSDPTDGKWLICDGRDTTGTAIELETHYPSLYMFLGGTNVLPDLREMVLVGAGENTTDGITTHDIYSLGQFKDDQLQGHEHWVGYKSEKASGTAYNLSPLGSNIGSDKTKGIIPDSVNGTPRVGETTHGKQKGVNYIIKAISEIDTYHLPSSEIAEVEQYVDAGLDVVKGKVAQAESYSTTEQRTGGTWIDWKPIYRKVVDCGALPNNANKYVPHNISNLETVVKLYAITSKGDDWMPLPEYYSSSGGIGLSLTTTDVFIQTYSNRSSYTSTYAIIEYTKTTD